MLETRSLRAGYGAINVLWDVEISVEAGKLTAIIGPNGAGKTTLLRAIMGQVDITSGEVAFDGVALKGTGTARLATLGLAMIPEGRMLFRDMSVEENLLLGAYPRHLRGAVALRLKHAYASFPRLLERRRQLAGSLSGGEAQMLAMARGLMAEPKLLMIDEPSLGLAPIVVREVFDELSRLKAAGRTMVLVEQNTRRAVDIADHVYLMQGGRIVLSLPAREVDLDALHRRYFSR